MKPILIGLYSSSMQSGKSTVALELTKALFGRKMAFAGPFYNFVVEVAAPFIGSVEETWAWMRDERKDRAIIPGLGVTLRSMLQTIGTNWGRECVNHNIWTLLAEQNALAALRSYSVVFDDMRFPNEFEMIKRNGGKCIRITRPGPARGNTSIAEGLLDDHVFDFAIYNNGTLDDLKKNVWYVKDLLQHV
jgi:hypothetical protein